MVDLGVPDLLKTRAFIAGQWQDAGMSQTYDVLNPATNKIIAKVTCSGANDAEKAVSAAHKAFKSWQEVSAKERSDLLLAWARELVAHQEDLAALITAEQGKPLSEAAGEIAYGASYVKWFGEEARRIYGDTLPSPSNDRRLICIKQPVGVVACITPWNFPNAMLARKIAPALAAGCTVVCKPSEATPLSANAMVELARQVGIPDGVINVVSGDYEAIGDVFTKDRRVRKLSFTGSTVVGKKLIAACAGTVKRISMELGGNAPFIVFEDADIDAAVDGLMMSKFRNAGQTCVCTNRIFVHTSIKDAFVQKVIDATKALNVGPGMQTGVSIGPLISKAETEKVEAMVADATEKGAQIAWGGTTHPLGGNFVMPTVLTDVTRSMRVFREEIFGPVAPIITFETEDEAITLANDTDAGLAAYFYARDIGRIWRVSEALEYGIIGTNVGAISNETAPFGGIKESGQGREGSKYGLDDYLEIKSICMGGIDQ